MQLLVWGLPLLSLATLAAVAWVPEWFSYFGIILPAGTKPVLLMVSGVGWLLRIAYRYRGEFQNASVSSLLEDVEVSQMRPRAVRLEGEILGRGVPGVCWSPDLVLRDTTGLIFVLYRQTIPLARFFFAITEAENYIGQHVVIEGWFRRGLTPYVEMSRLTGEDGAVHRTYSRWIQSGLAIAAVVAGWIWLTS